MAPLLAAVVTLGLVTAPSLLPSQATPAEAEETTTLQLIMRWQGSQERGNHFTTSVMTRRIVASVGVAFSPLLSCSGPDCDPARPGRVEVLRRGTWKTWTTGTLAELEESSRRITSRKPTTFIVRSVLSAHDGSPAITSARWKLSYHAKTNVSISGSTIIKPTPANFYEWQFRPGPGSVTVQVSPATAGRVVEIRDTLKDGYPLLATASTNSAGRATVSGDFSDVALLNITVLPNRLRAGWYVGAMPLAI